MALISASMHALAPKLCARPAFGQAQLGGQNGLALALSSSSWLHEAARRRGHGTAATASNGAASNSAQAHLSAAPDASPAASVLASSDDLDGAGSKQLRDSLEIAYLSGRSNLVCRHFPGAFGADDFLARVEIALYAFGFSGDNTITMVNLCRDEVTNTLKHKIDSVFGAAFNTNGLGGVLTCGVSGVAAGLSHSPVSRTSGKERYIFFSFPHISIDSCGNIGALSRPSRSGESCACGALQKALVDIRREGLTSNCKIPGVHDARDPEFSILKQRIARRLRFEGATDDSVTSLGLVELTKVAERTITDDLEYLISETVDPSRADYAVITGVQIHNWGAQFDDDSPNLEFVAPTAVYVVVNGEKSHIDLAAMPPLTPRQVRALAAHGGGEGGGGGRRGDDTVCNAGGMGTLREIEPPYLYNSREMKRREREKADIYAALLAQENLHPSLSCAWPSWQSVLKAALPHRNEHDSSVVIDSKFESGAELEGLLAKLQGRYLMQEAANGNGQAANGSSGEAASGSGVAQSPAGKAGKVGKGKGKRKGHRA